MLIIFSAAATANVLVVKCAQGRGVHECRINVIRNVWVIVNAPGVELDGERVAIVTDSADGRRVDKNQFCGTSMRSIHASIVRP